MTSDEQRSRPRSALGDKADASESDSEATGEPVAVEEHNASADRTGSRQSQARAESGPSSGVTHMDPMIEGGRDDAGYGEGRQVAANNAPTGQVGWSAPGGVEYDHGEPPSTRGSSSVERVVDGRALPVWAWPAYGAVCALIIPLALGLGATQAWLVTLALVIVAILASKTRDIASWLWAPSRRLVRVPMTATALIGALALGATYLPDPPPLHGTAAEDAVLAGSLGVANVTAGHKRYDSGVPVSDGDVVAFHVYLRNLSVSADTQQIRIDYESEELPGGNTEVRILAVSPSFTPIASVVQIYHSGNRIELVPSVNTDVTVRKADASEDPSTVSIAKVSRLPMSIVAPGLSSEPGRDDLTVRFEMLVRARES